MLNLGWSLATMYTADSRPYSGLFLPYEEPWLNQGLPRPGSDQYNVTFDTINDHYLQLAQEGFLSLSYFDIGSWGVNVTLPPANNTPDYCGYRPPYNFPAPCPNASGASHYLQVSLAARQPCVVVGSPCVCLLVLHVRTITCKPLSTTVGVWTVDIVAGPSCVSSRFRDVFDCCSQRPVDLQAAVY
jgi:hypothetical protein